LRVGGERERVQVAGDVAPAPRVGVVTPRAADVRAALQEQEGAPGLAQPDGGAQPAEARADHGHVDVPGKAGAARARAGEDVGSHQGQRSRNLPEVTILRVTFWVRLVAMAMTAAAGAVEEIRREQAEFIAGLVAAELPDHDPRRAEAYAQAVIGACERLAARRASDPTLDPDTLTAAVMDVMWVGFAALKAGRRWSPR